MKPSDAAPLCVVPITLAEAKAFIKRIHRHHKPPTGHVFSLAVARPGLPGEDPIICGVATVGRPVSRFLQDGWTLEVNRVATDGTRNACSKLYGAAWKVAKELGWRRLITYTLPEEGGASLRGAGWVCLGSAGKKNGKGWSCESRPRVDLHPLQEKIIWEAPS